MRTKQRPPLSYPVRDDTHMWSMKIVKFSRPLPLVHLCPKLFDPLDLGSSISNEPPPLQMITNQLKENNPRMTII